jgi:hypothetical protein
VAPLQSQRGVYGRPYTPRHDFQGISDDAELGRIKARIPGISPRFLSV